MFVYSVQHLISQLVRCRYEIFIKTCAFPGTGKILNGESNCIRNAHRCPYSCLVCICYLLVLVSILSSGLIVCIDAILFNLLFLKTSVFNGCLWPFGKKSYGTNFVCVLCVL
jgi:hypothetical protein